MRPALVTLDVGAAGLIAASMMQYLPPIAALLGVLWYAIQVYESKTVQKWLRAMRLRHRLRRLARAQADVVVAQAQVTAGARTDQLAATAAAAKADVEADHGPTENLPG